MKILLLHEFSGVHTELRKGLRSLGLEADIATYGDYYKNYPSDLDIGAIEPNFSSKLDRLRKQIDFPNKFKKYDVIQTISPDPFTRILRPFLEKLIFSEKSKSVYVAAVSDAIYRKHIRELAYCPPHDWTEKHSVYRLKKLLKKINKVIPICWDYKYCMERAKITTEPVMPFPIDMPRIKKLDVGNNRKIIVFHPLNRENLLYDFKGTLIIQEAFKYLSKRYSDIADFICAGGMNHREYADFTKNVDIIVDQSYSFSYGMSAAYGLANGQVVLSGMEEAAREGHYLECPIINITPSKENIIKKIENLILNREKIREISDDSRQYAEKFHDTRKVAERFLKIYKEI